MSVWDQYNKKTTYVNVIADSYRHLFSMPKKELRKLLNGYSLTQLKHRGKNTKKK